MGLPLGVGNRLYNCAAVIAGGRVVGVVPKQHLPGYREFYEPRRFTPADGTEPQTTHLGGEDVPFGVDLLFRAEAGGDPLPGAVVGVEICEDLWVPTPPSAFQALAGATVLLNLSGSNETVGKGAYRRQLVAGQSGRCVAAYAYAGAGPTESTTDLVLGGECLVADNGGLLARADSYTLGEQPSSPNGGRTGWRGAVSVEAEIDLGRLVHDRRVMTSFQVDRRVGTFAYRHVPFAVTADRAATATVNGTPFVPRSGPELAERCREIFSIQCCGLAKRLSRLADDSPLQIGVSGGLDSTLALLVACKTLDGLGQSRERIRGLTMPGFGTTDRTKSNADALMDQLGTGRDEIDIRQLCLDAFRGLGHEPFGLEPAETVEGFQEQLSGLEPGAGDLVFENVQARIRTFLLMSRGFVLGTGDMSELALGWCTYNADHMSMYNVNCSVPKTLVAFLVRHAADEEFDGEARATLHSIADTVISPELLPASASGEIAQSTEDALGPYELHDFFLYHVVRNGFGPAKILDLAGRAEFRGEYPTEVIGATLRTFVRRFFQNQFKRSCVPDGPKVGTVSLSPRGDWRMPSDAEADAWLADLDG